MCHANQMGLQDEIPGKISKVQYESRTELAVVISRDDRYLVRTIPEGVRFAGMIDFPRAGPPEAADVVGMESWLADQLGGDVRIGMCLKTIKHAVTRYRMTLHVHIGEWIADGDRVAESGPIPDSWQWATVDELADMPMSVTGRKIVRLLDRPQRSLFSEL